MSELKLIVRILHKWHKCSKGWKEHKIPLASQFSCCYQRVTGRREPAPACTRGKSVRSLWLPSYHSLLTCPHYGDTAPVWVFIQLTHLASSSLSCLSSDGADRTSTIWNERLSESSREAGPWGALTRSHLEVIRPPVPPLPVANGRAQAMEHAGSKKHKRATHQTANASYDTGTVHRVGKRHFLRSCLCLSQEKSIAQGLDSVWTVNPQPSPSAEWRRHCPVDQGPVTWRPFSSPGTLGSLLINHRSWHLTNP